MSAWTRSSFCNADQPMCVEVLADIDTIRVRDSKAPSVTLEFTRAEWDSFLAGVLAGEFS